MLRSRTQAARVAAIGLGLAACVFGTGTASAQTAGCDLPPVTLPLFDATPAAIIAEATLPPAASMPQVDDAQLQQAVERIMNCANSDAQAERYAIFTDRYIADLFTGDDRADQPAFEQMMELGYEPSPERYTLEGIESAEQTDDGRIEITLSIATPSGSVSDRLILAWSPDADAWLVDEVLELDPPPAE